MAGMKRKPMNGSIPVAMNEKTQLCLAKSSLTALSLHKLFCACGARDVFVGLKRWQAGGS
jgi:hypothetical protein